MSISDKVKDCKLKIDKLLYEKDVFFLVEETSSNEELPVYVYLTSPNNKKQFGFIAYDEDTKKIAFAAEWSEMVRRNRLEGLESPEHFILLESEDEFVNYLSGVLLTEILHARKVKEKKKKSKDKDKDKDNLKKE